MKTVVLYTRKGCCLCEQAREALEQIRLEHPFVLQERDIDDSEALQRAYFERIPVVTIDGVEASELALDTAEVRRRLDIVRTG